MPSLNGAEKPQRRTPPIISRPEPPAPPPQRSRLDKPAMYLCLCCTQMSPGPLEQCPHCGADAQSLYLIKTETNAYEQEPTDA